MPDHIDRHPVTERFEFFGDPGEDSGVCPYCGQRMVAVSQGLKKCLRCGYRQRQRGDVQRQHHYDFNRASLRLMGYHQPSLPPTDQEFNMLVDAGWDPEQAFEEVAADFGMSGMEMELFRTRVTEMDGEPSPMEVEMGRKSSLAPAEWAGYVAHAPNKYSGGETVIVRSKEQGVDVGQERYAVVCDAHGQMVGAPNIRMARRIMAAPYTFCEQCNEQAAKRFPDEAVERELEDAAIVGEMVGWRW